MRTDEIRGKLRLAKTLDEVRSGGGDGARQEALTLAICELLESGLVLADPAELAPELCGEQLPDRRFLCELPTGHSGGHRAPRFEAGAKRPYDREAAAAAIDSAEPIPPAAGG